MRGSERGKRRRLREAGRRRRRRREMWSRRSGEGGLELELEC